MKKTIWLSREGAMFGPYGEDEVVAMRAAGELDRYGWIWGMDSGQWTPVHPRPGADPVQPEEEVEQEIKEEVKEEIKAEPVAQTPAAQAPVSAAPAASPAPSTMPTSRPAAPGAGATAAPARAFHVICHDQRTIVAGVIRSVREGGCIVSSDQGLSDLAPFRKGAKIWVNLLDEARDRTENVEAVISDVRKQEAPEEHWSYDLSWSRAPEILKDA